MLVFGGVHLFDNHGFNLPFGWSFGDVFNFSSSKKTKAATTHTPRKLTWNLKMMLSKRDLLFKRGSLPSLGEPTVVSFGECTSIDALLQLKKKSVNNTEKWGQCIYNAMLATSISITAMTRTYDYIIPRYSAQGNRLFICHHLPPCDLIEPLASWSLYPI